jgi:cellulose synthase/poly-beta-1,6-N-acetylglucosamine synthase-like glycosyltransferase
VVRRPDDDAAAAVVQASSGLTCLREAIVDQPGQVAALLMGATLATGDIIAMIDDDVVCRSDWCLRMREWFGSPNVSGLGGRDIVHYAGDVIGASLIGPVGVLQPSGRPIGNHHRGSGYPRYVDILKGCNVAYRRSALAFPIGLRGSGAEVANDMATSLRASSSGQKLVYDPRLLVDHYPGERFDGDNRMTRSPEAQINAIRNEISAIVSARPEMTIRYVAYHTMIGHRSVPGFVRYVLMRLRGDDRGTLPLRLIIASVVSEAWNSWRRPLQFNQIGDVPLGASP